MRLVVQGVGQRFDSHFDRARRSGEARATRLVVIGDHLDAAVLQAELQSALAESPRNRLRPTACICCPHAPVATWRMAARAWCAWSRRRVTSSS